MLTIRDVDVISWRHTRSTLGVHVRLVGAIEGREEAGTAMGLNPLPMLCLLAMDATVAPPLEVSDGALVRKARSAVREAESGQSPIRVCQDACGPCVVQDEASKVQLVVYIKAHEQMARVCCAHQVSVDLIGRVLPLAKCGVGKVGCQACRSLAQRADEQVGIVPRLDAVWKGLFIAPPFEKNGVGQINRLLLMDL